jgi:hypothetical protein
METMENSVTIIGIPTEIRIDNPPSTSLEHYGYSSLRSTLDGWPITNLFLRNG